MMKPPRHLTLALVTGALAIGGLAACGGDDDSGSGDSTPTASESTGNAPAETTGGESGGGGNQTIALAADPDGALAFDETELTAESGPATLDFENASGVPHAVEIEGDGIEEETETVTGGKATLALDLKPGTYEFYCPIGNHEDAGMKGVLTVK